MLEAEYMLFMLNSSLTIFVDFLLFFFSAMDGDGTWQMICNSTCCFHCSFSCCTGICFYMRDVCAVFFLLVDL